MDKKQKNNKPKYEIRHDCGLIELLDSDDVTLFIGTKEECCRYFYQFYTVEDIVSILTGKRCE